MAQSFAATVVGDVPNAQSARFPLPVAANTTFVAFIAPVGPACPVVKVQEPVAANVSESVRQLPTRRAPQNRASPLLQ